MAFAERIDFSPKANWQYTTGLGRALAGAMMFSLPMLMTMEMWWLGFYLDGARLIQFAVVNFIVLIGLSRVSGFEQTVKWREDVMDALSAYGVAAVWSAVILWVFGVIAPGEPLVETVGKIVIQSAPASFGAMLAGKQLGSGDLPGAERERASYWGQLLLMLAGALFLGFNVAPTEEMILIAFRMSALQSIILVIISIIFLHGIVYTVGFRGQERPQAPTSFWWMFLMFTLVGYAIALAVSLYLLWTFGRVEGTSPAQIAGMVAVLAFPGAIGAAVARLVV